MADIGGTNARFALLEPNAESGAAFAPPAELARRDYATSEFGTGLELVAQALNDFACAPQACVLALAGPVAQDSLTERVGALTNGGQEFDAAGLREQFGCNFLLINDFVAVAAAIGSTTAVTPVGSWTKQGARHDAANKPGAGVCAVLGAGTGLGMAYLVPAAGSAEYEVYASEGGNADFAPVNELEQEVLALLRPELGTVRIESLVSGPGLVNLYNAVCTLWGNQPLHTDAAAITADALAGDPVSHQCLSMFCGMLGTAAGNFALATGARGGVYLAGGILPRIREFFLASEFRARFDDRGPLASFNQQIPTFLVDEQEPGLLGAARQAQRFIGLS